MKKAIEGFEKYYIDYNGNIYNSKTNKKLKPNLTKHGYYITRLMFNVSHSTISEIINNKRYKEVC